MRKRIAAGNWKMNLDATEAQWLLSETVQIIRSEYTGTAEVVFAPPFPYLGLVHHQIKDYPGFYLSGQNVHQSVSGAFTGEVSAPMLASMHCSHCIVGHSERRQYFHEGNALLAEKINRLLERDITPIYCIGETLEEREAGHTLEVNRVQLSEGAFHLDAAAFSKLVIAYEPVWAIGTGRTASPEQAQEVHAYIRTLIAAQYGAEVAASISILYGGSVKADNAKVLFAQPDIDGGLVGGASLKSREFAEIVKAL
ncbi:MAG: triose-phosphate isomerase [Bacteroidetes bacterium]|jgi:triosephosphate isomerase (TIM)|nr:MAG: triose-phosphate isomerase [Bacteroidota bacterium]